ncbi:M1 family peptidase, partial [Streptomyces cellulosae]
MPLTSRNPALLTSRRPTPQTPRRPATRVRRRTAQALLASAVGVCLVAAGTPAEPLGIGDPLFPHLGNPGYDVQAYHLDLTYP